MSQKSSTKIDTFVRENEQRLLDELLTLIRIPSISTSPEHKGDVEKAARYVADALGKAGLENVEMIPTSGHPLVYGDWLHAPGKPTVLCYGHYDVQPPDPLELWETPPFEPIDTRTETSMRAARPTTKARCTCTSRPWRRCARQAVRCR